MDRLEKKKLRLEIEKILDEDCRTCPFNKDAEYYHHCRNICPSGLKMQAITDELAAGKLNIYAPTTQERHKPRCGRWTKDEELYLVNHLKHFDVAHIAKRLNRDETSVWAKIQRLRKNVS